jgi:hypothetical protein
MADIALKQRNYNHRVTLNERHIMVSNGVVLTILHSVSPKLILLRPAQPEYAASTNFVMPFRLGLDCNFASHNNI